MLPKLRFHSRCGDRVTLVCNKKTVVRNCSHLLGALSFSAQALRDNELFEVRIVKKEGVWNGHIDLGVTCYDPNHAEYMPLAARQIQEPTWIMSGSTILKNGTCVADSYGDDLDMLVEGDCLGVMRSHKGELIYFINNHCLGVAAENVTANVFAVIELTGKYMEVTITRVEVIPEDVRLRQQQIVVLEEPSSSSFNEIPMAESIELDSPVSATEQFTPRSAETTPHDAVTSLSSSTDSDVCPHKSNIRSVEDDQSIESAEEDIPSASEKENVPSPPILSCSDIRDKFAEGNLDGMQLFNCAVCETLCGTPDSHLEVKPLPLESTPLESPKDIATSSNEKSKCTNETLRQAAVTSTSASSHTCKTYGVAPENLDQIAEAKQTSNTISQPVDNPPLSGRDELACIDMKNVSVVLSSIHSDTKYESHSQMNRSDDNLSPEVVDQGDETCIEEADTRQPGIEEGASSNTIISDSNHSRPSKLFDTITKETVNRLRSRRALEAYGEDSDTEKANIECTSLPDACISAAATAPQTQYYNITGELVDKWARGREVTGDTEDESDSDSIYNDYREIGKIKRNSPQIEIHHTSPPASPSPELSTEFHINTVVWNKDHSVRHATETEDEAQDRRSRQTSHTSIYRLGTVLQQDWADPRDGSPPLVHGEAAHLSPPEEAHSSDDRDSEGLREVVVEPNIVLPNLSSPEDLSSQSGSSVSEVPPDYSDPCQGNIISAADNRDPFRFHKNRGTSIKFSSDFLVAERVRPMDDYNNAVCLTHRPLNNNELFEIRIEKLIDKWSGGIELGVTGHNPRHMELPSTMTNLSSRTFIMSGCKVLVNGKPSGVQLSNFSLDDIQVGDCVGMTRNRAGNLHFYLNGVDQGKAASDVPSTVWGVVDLYGTAVKVSVVNSAQQAPQPILPQHQPESEEHRFHFIPRAILPAEIDNDTLLFHSSQCSDIVVVDNGKSAHRVDSTETLNSCVGIVTTERPLLDNELFEVRLDELSDAGTGSLKIGVSTQTPKHQDYIQHIHNYISTWALVGKDIIHEGNVIVHNFTEDLNTLVEGDKVGVLRSDKGELHLFVNGIDKGLAVSNIPEIVYGFIDLSGRATKVSIVPAVVGGDIAPQIVIVPESTRIVPEPPVPELCFNRVHGRNAHLSSDMTVASRPAEFSEFNEGVLFSSRPLRECELFQVRVDKIVDCWIGSLEIGVTALKPSELESCGVERVAGTATELMWHTYVLSGASVVSDGACLVQRYPLDLDSVTRGSHVGVMWHGDRSLHFYMDGIDQGHACFLPPHLELYAVIDLYGQCTEVTLVAGREHWYWDSGHSDTCVALMDGLQGSVQPAQPDSFSEYCGQNVVISSKEKIAQRVSRDQFGSLVFSASHLAKGQKFEVAVLKCDDSRMATFSFGLTDLNILNVHVNRNFPGRISQIPNYCCYLSDGDLVVNNNIQYNKTGLFPVMGVYTERVALTRHQNGDVSVAYNHIDLGVVFTDLPEKVFVVFDISGCVSGLQAIPPRKIKFAPYDLPREKVLMEEEERSQTGHSEQMQTEVKPKFTFKCLSPENLILSDNDTKATRVSDYKGGIVVTKQALRRGNSFKFTIESEKVGYASGLMVGAVRSPVASALCVNKQCWILSSTVLNIHGNLTLIPPRMKARFRTMRLNSIIEVKFSECSELILFIDQMKVGVIAIIPDEITEITPLVDIRGKCQQISIVNDERDVCKEKKKETMEGCEMCDNEPDDYWDRNEILKEHALKNFAHTIKELLPSKVFYDSFENNSLSIDGEVPSLLEWLEASSVILDPLAPQIKNALYSDTDSESFNVSQVEVECQEDLNVNQLPDDVYNLMTTGVIGFLPEDVKVHECQKTSAYNSIADNSINDNRSKSSDGVCNYIPNKSLDAVNSPTTDVIATKNIDDMQHLHSTTKQEITNIPRNGIPNTISGDVATQELSGIITKNHEKDSSLNMDKSQLEMFALEQKHSCLKEKEKSPIVIPKLDDFLKHGDYSRPEAVQNSTEITQKRDAICNKTLDPLPNDNITQEFEEVFSSLKNEMMNYESNNMTKLSEDIVDEPSKIIVTKTLEETVNKTSQVSNDHTFTDTIGIDEKPMKLSENDYKLLEDFIYVCYKQELESAALASLSDVESSTFVLKEDWESITTLINGVYNVVAGSGKEAAEYLLGKIISPATIQNDSDSDDSDWDDSDSQVLENNDPKVAGVSDKLQEAGNKQGVKVEKLEYSVMETINESYDDTISAEVSNHSDSDQLSQHQSSVFGVSESFESSKEENPNPLSIPTHSSQEERVSELVSDKSDVKNQEADSTRVNSLDEEISDINSDVLKEAELSEKDKSCQNSVEQEISEIQSNDKDESDMNMHAEIQSDSLHNLASGENESHLILDSPSVSLFDEEASEMENTHESSKNGFAKELSSEEASLSRKNSDPIEISTSNSPSKNSPVSSSGSLNPPLRSPTNYNICPPIKHSRISKSMPDLTKYHNISIYKDSYFKDIFNNLVTYHLNNGGTLKADTDSGYKFFIQLHLILYGNSVPFVKPVLHAKSQIHNKEESTSSNNSSSEQSQSLNQKESASQDLQIRKAVLGTSPQYFLSTIINESHPIISNIDQKKNPAIDLFLYAVAENDANIRSYILDDLIETNAIIDPFEYADEEHIQLHEFFETLRHRYVSSEYNDDVFSSYDNDYEESLTGRGPLMFVEGIVGANSDTGITFMMNSNVVTRNPRQKQFGYPYTSVYDIKIRPLKEKDRPNNFDNNNQPYAKYVNKSRMSDFLHEEREINKERDKKAMKLVSSLNLKKKTGNVMSTQFYIPDSESDAFNQLYGSYLLGLILDRGLIGDDCAQYSESSFMNVAESCTKLGSVMHFWWNWVPDNKRALLWGNVECYCDQCIPAGAPHWIKDWVRVSRASLCPEPLFGRFWSIRAGLLPNLLSDSAHVPLALVKSKRQRRPPLSKTIQPDKLFSTLWIDEYGKVCIVNIVIEIIPDRDEDTMLSYLIHLTTHSSEVSTDTQ